MRQKINNRQLVVLAIIVFLLVIMMIASLIYIRKQADETNQIDVEQYKEYIRHYAFITDSMEDNFWNEVYDGAAQFSDTRGVYLERMGEGLDTNYSKAELLKIAIAAGVDGIILEGDESGEIRNLIDEAVKKEIPVVTVLTDSNDSGRQSFVGIGNYNLGREYGRQIVRVATKETKEVLILMDTVAEDSGQNLVFNGIRETLANEGNHLNLELKTLAMNGDTPYSEEEAIRSLFLYRETLPDIIICLNEKNTISAYQAVIDYNLVGKVDILGYYVTDTILKAISRKVISSTIAVDTGQMGMDSVKALDEYIETGYVSDFVTLDVSTVMANNVEEYMHDAAKKDKE